MYASEQYERSLLFLTFLITAYIFLDVYNCFYVHMSSVFISRYFFSIKYFSILRFPLNLCQWQDDRYV